MSEIGHYMEACSRLRTELTVAEAERDEAQQLAVQATEEAESYRKRAGVTEYHQLRRTRAEKQLADELDHVAELEAEVTQLREALARAAYVSRNLFNMIDRETWRAEGGDDMQGHYEGDYHAEQVSIEIEGWAALAVPSPEEK